MVGRRVDFHTACFALNDILCVSDKQHLRFTVGHNFDLPSVVIRERNLSAPGRGLGFPERRMFVVKGYSSRS